jgi:PhoH-like ATPase
MRILADIFGLQAEDYKNSKVQGDELYTGIKHLAVDQQCIDLMYTLGKFNLEDAQPFLDEAQLGSSFEYKEEFKGYVPSPNECFVFHSNSNSKQTALTRYNSILREFNVLPQDMKTCDILPRNAEQAFALDVMKDTSVELVTLTAKAGCGKTYLAIAAALYGVIETQTYKKILLLKPIVPMDNSHELGFLPGSMEEKLGPWMASYGDNIEQIMAKYIKEDDFDKGKKPKNKKEEKQQEDYFEKQKGKTSPIQELIAQGMLEFGSLEHSRGRNWKDTYVIIDEAQNTSKNTMKTILTRIGEGSKIIVMGDPSQIDSPYLDSKNNGLVIVQTLFKDHAIAGHVTLTKSERSKLAELASELLK